jgi:hypothetical protein
MKTGILGAWGVFVAFGWALSACSAAPDEAAEDSTLSSETGDQLLNCASPLICPKLQPHTCIVFDPTGTELNQCCNCNGVCGRLEPRNPATPHTLYCVAQ